MLKLQQEFKRWLNRAIGTGPYAPRFPKPQYLEGIGLSLVTLDAEGFFHFLHELMPKVALMKPLFDKVEYIFVNGGETSWQPAWLERAGVPSEKLVWVSGLSHYRCQQVIFASALIRDVQPNPWSIGALRTLLKSSPAHRGRRWLWASRSDAKTRQIQWEDQFLNAWPQFEVVRFSELSPAEAIALCGEAEVFAGPHGAAFANLVFCPPETCAIEFLPPWHNKPEYRRLAQVCGQHHATVVVDFEQQEAEAELHELMERFLASVLPSIVVDRER